MKSLSGNPSDVLVNQNQSPVQHAAVLGYPRERARLLARIYSYLLARAEEIEAAEGQSEPIAAIAETKGQPS